MTIVVSVDMFPFYGDSQSRLYSFATPHPKKKQKKTHKQKQQPNCDLLDVFIFQAINHSFKIIDTNVTSFWILPICFGVSQWLRLHKIRFPPFFFVLCSVVCDPSLKTENTKQTINSHAWDKKKKKKKKKKRLASHSWEKKKKKKKIRLAQETYVH